MSCAQWIASTQTCVVHIAHIIRYYILSLCLSVSSSVCVCFSIRLISLWVRQCPLKGFPVKMFLGFLFLFNYTKLYSWHCTLFLHGSICMYQLLIQTLYSFLFYGFNHLLLLVLILFYYFVVNYCVFVFILVMISAININIMITLLFFSFNIF